MDLLKRIHEWVQKGYEIRYDIVDQIENGYEDEVRAGNMPKFTYSYYICQNENELWMYSVDTLEEGFSMALQWLHENQ